MVCVRECREEGGGGGGEEERVVGLHLSGPNAGEVLQGFALAIRLVGPPCLPLRLFLAENHGQ